MFLNFQKMGRHLLLQVPCKLLCYSHGIRITFNKTVFSYSVIFSCRYYKTPCYVIHYVTEFMLSLQKSLLLKTESNVMS